MESNTKKAGQEESTINGEQNSLLAGSVDIGLHQYKFYKDLQMDSFAFWPPNESFEHIELFANKVFPKVKEDVKRESRNIAKTISNIKSLLF